MKNNVFSKSPLLINLKIIAPLKIYPFLKIKSPFNQILLSATEAEVTFVNWTILWQRISQARQYYC